jgi:hypothetical protein
MGDASIHGPGAQVAAGALALHAFSLAVALAAAAIIMPWARDRRPALENS